MSRIQALRRLVAAMVPALLLAACGGGGSNNPPGGNNPPVNQPPVVKIDAPEGEVMELSTVRLSAAGSTDPEGDAPTFEWKQISGPAVSISDAGAAEIMFTAPKVTVEETLKFEVIVSDGDGQSAKESVDISINEAEAIVYLEYTDRESELISPNQSLWLLHPALDLPLEIAEADRGSDILAWKVSPDRKRIAYRIEREDASEALFVAMLDGSKTLDVSSLLPASGTFEQFEWSGDGKNILLLYDGRFPDFPELFRVDVTGEDGNALVKQLSPALVDENGDGLADNAGDDVEEFYLSPAGNLVAFATLDSLMVSALDGAIVDIAPDVDTLPSAVEWSFDGKFVAFTGKRINIDRTELFVAEPARENSVRVVSGDLGPGDVAAHEQFWQWSPNSHRLAFVGDLRTPDDTELFVVDVSAEDPAGTRIIASGEPGTMAAFIKAFQWSPDGNSIAFHGFGFDTLARELLVSRFTETGVERSNASGLIVDGGGVDTADLSGQAFAWSPDSRYLAFIGDLETVNERQVYLIEANGSEGRKTLFNTAGCAFDDPYDLVTWSPDSKLLLTSCSVDGNINQLFGFRAESSNSLADRISFTGAINDLLFFASYPDGSRIVVNADFPDGQRFHELLEVTEATAGEPRRLLLTQDPATGLEEFSLIGPAGVIDRH